MLLAIVRINVPRATYLVMPPSWGYSSCVGPMIAAAESAMRYAMCASMLDILSPAPCRFRESSSPLDTPVGACILSSFYDTQRDTHGPCSGSARHGSGSGWRFHRGPGMWPAEESDQPLQILLRQEPCRQGSIDVWTGTSAAGTAKTGGVNTRGRTRGPGGAGRPDVDREHA